MNEGLREKTFDRAHDLGAPADGDSLALDRSRTNVPQRSPRPFRRVWVWTWNLKRGVAECREIFARGAAGFRLGSVGIHREFTTAAVR